MAGTPEPFVPSFRCPACGTVSHHPDDERFGYCANCHAFTGAGVVTGRLEGVAPGGLTGMTDAIKAARVNALRQMAEAAKPVFGGLTRVEVQSGTAESLSDNGTKTFHPFVTVQAHDDKGQVMAGQLYPDELRAMALQFLAVAESADQDSLVFTVMHRDLGSPVNAITQFVAALRHERDAARAVREADGEPHL